MPVTINASPTNGLVQTADGSGVIKLQSNGVTTNALAWVNFNGTGTVAIRSSYNVSSITDNGTGDYTVNFTNAFADTNYVLLITGGDTGGATAIAFGPTVPPTTTTSRIAVVNSAGALSDRTNINVAVFGN